MTPDPYMTQLAKDYRAAREALLSHRFNHLKFRTLVRVNAPRYRGLGVVQADSSCPADEVPVLLGNGNTWWYPVECVAPSDEPVPRELRHRVLESAGINHL